MFGTQLTYPMQFFPTKGTIATYISIHLFLYLQLIHALDPFEIIIIFNISYSSY